MELIIDVENTTTTKNNKLHLDPFERTNALVMVGIYPLGSEDSSTYIFDHVGVTREDDPISNYYAVQGYLDQATLLIGHNISHDLLWLWESGFKYEGKVFDTMLAEYVLQRGVTNPLGLKAVAERYECETKKEDTLKEYFKRGYSTREIPRLELETYLRHDLGATKEVYEKIQNRLSDVENQGLKKTIDITNEVAVVLSRMYQSGFKIDRNKLSQVRKEFEEEKLDLEKKLNSYTRYLMGDTPINLGSPEQLSWVLFSRQPIDKKRWASSIQPNLPTPAFKNLIKFNFKTLYKTRAEQCNSCKGKGSYFKKKKTGGLYKKPTKCSVCNGTGFIYKQTKDIAGLKFSPPSVKWASANGFSTSKSNLEVLERVASTKGMDEAKTFLGQLRRLSAITSYLSNFVDGIENFLKEDDFLHVKLNQHVTSTGRFSGSNPNMQNMPRGSTFPVKKVFVSRFDGGKIMEADFAQLEFRVAAFLSQDSTAIKEVTEGFDVHAYTAKVISDAGQPTTRQVAKAHTFAPLYGASGYGRTRAEATYYEHFLEKYKGIGKWHKKLANQAVNYGYIKIPSGREFSFPDTKRRRDGSVTNFTQIKNYPVQSFATADIVPLVLVQIYNSIKHLKSVVVNSVHDSIVIDIHPDEINEIQNVIKEVQKNLVKLLETKYGIEFNVPLLLEAKIGNNWLEQIDI
tara:strand:+ start:15235 stop:17286 length:2052 start_codon:yes stop_codon:yes gene_type:complete